MVVIHSTVFYRLYCYRRHSSVRRHGSRYCYRAHIFFGGRLEHPAQFPVFRVVIPSTVYILRLRAGHKFYCYSVHNLHFFGAAAGCYRAHIFCCAQKSEVVICGTFQKFCHRKPLLLFTAHFRFVGCYSVHSFQSVEFWVLLLFTTHF